MAVANAANVSLEPKPRTDNGKVREQKRDHTDKRHDGNVDGEQRNVDEDLFAARSNSPQKVTTTLPFRCGRDETFRIAARFIFRNP
jgi:hypothetical protein